MKITIEMKECDIQGALDSIPKDWYNDPYFSPIRILAFALKKAYESIQRRSN